MRLRDVPVYPAYLVFHDAYSNGEMDVHPFNDFQEALRISIERNEKMAQIGQDDCGFWKAYIKLPRKKIFKFYPEGK